MADSRYPYLELGLVATESGRVLPSRAGLGESKWIFRDKECSEKVLGFALVDKKSRS